MVEATKSLILLDFWHFRDVWLLTTERAEAVRSTPALGLEWRWVRRFAGRLPACPRYAQCCVCGDRVPESECGRNGRVGPAGYAASGLCAKRSPSTGPWRLGRA